MIESHGLSGIAHVIHMVRLVNGRSGNKRKNENIANSVYVRYTWITFMNAYPIC